MSASSAGEGRARRRVPRRALRRRRNLLGAVAGGHDVAGKHALVEMAELQRVLDRSLPAAILACGGLCPGHRGPPRVAGNWRGGRGGTRDAGCSSRLRAGLWRAAVLRESGRGGVDRGARARTSSVPGAKLKARSGCARPRARGSSRRRLRVICPDDIEGRLGLRVARTQHVGEVEADARPDAVFFEPGEPGRKSVPPLPLIAISSAGSEAAYSAASCTAASTWRRMTRSG